MVTVPADGRVCVYTMSTTDVVVDLDGWLPADQPFHAVGPHRVLDTRQVSAVLSDVAVAVAPSGAVGAVVNVTVTEPAAAGFATVYPCGNTVPLASNLNFVAGATVAAAALVPVDAAGRICVHTSSPAHVVVDVAGWLQTGFTPVVPFRAIDTRSLGPPVTDVVVDPGSFAGVAGVALTLTITDPTAAGYATVYPCGQVPPLVSNINFAPGQTVANAVVATPDPQGRICVHTLVPTHVVVDVSGTSSDGAGRPLRFRRLLVLRSAIGARSARRRTAALGHNPYPASGVAALLSEEARRGRLLERPRGPVGTRPGATAGLGEPLRRDPELPRVWARRCSAASSSAGTSGRCSTAAAYRR